MTDREKLDAAIAELERQRDWWEQVPSGVDECANPTDESPDDDMQWRAGCALRTLRETLGKLKGEKR